MRAESEIFAELSTLCQSPGYVHAIAFFCFRDCVIGYSDEMTAKDMAHLFSRSRLIRTEISTLIGLLIKAEICWSIPAPAEIQSYIERTDALLEELHKVLTGSVIANFDLAQVTAPGFNPFANGRSMREPIFYSGEAAYSFQYRDFSMAKYQADDGWLKTNKGFGIQDAKIVIHEISKLQNEKFTQEFTRLRQIHPNNWTLLPCHKISLSEIQKRTGIQTSNVNAVFSAFTLPNFERNFQFRALNDFNAYNATPLLLAEDGAYISLQIYSLTEALYESPFYWMVPDRKYQPKAMANRGKFTETFCEQRLIEVFGKENVYVGVSIIKTKELTLGEIDVLVLFGNRAVVLQAKSKKLSLDARKGNDGKIKDDFKKGVQDAYDQGLQCSKLLTQSNLRLVAADGRTPPIPKALSEIYIFCVVADHYPALGFQAEQFLKYEKIEAIQAPLVMDIFTLDAIVEMLASPLYFLSYINRRSNYKEKIISTHELTILSYHLKQNLWIDNEHEVILLDDSISADLDLAMTVRRDGVEGKATPDGILTRQQSGPTARILRQIEKNPTPDNIDLGFFLLTMGEGAVDDLNSGIEKLMQLSQKDGKGHDLTLGFSAAGGGLTVHCNDDPISTAGPSLINHCERRKYTQRAKQWFGMTIHPSTGEIRYGYSINRDWQVDAKMEQKQLGTLGFKGVKGALSSMGKKHKKIGRNDLCHCGSGLKYKKCCLGKPANQITEG